MNTETLKKIAELAYPDAECTQYGETYPDDILVRFSSSSWITIAQDELLPEVELKLIRMYREWVVKNCEGFRVSLFGRMFEATESTQTLLEAIERDMIRKV